MADARVELIEALTAATSRDEYEAVWAMYHPDVVYDWSRSRGPYHGVYSGLAEVQRFLEGMQDAWADLEFFHTELIPCGRGVVRVGGMRAKGRSSGVGIEATGAQLFEFEDGLVRRVTLFQSRDEALAAAGAD